MASWAGVCFNLTTAIEAELQHHRQGTRSKKLEPLFATVFKDFMQRARSRHDAGVCAQPPPERCVYAKVSSSVEPLRAQKTRRVLVTLLCTKRAHSCACLKRHG